jgi:hypothetical protein
MELVITTGNRNFTQMEAIILLETRKKERKQEKKKIFLLTTNELLSSSFRSLSFLSRTLLEQKPLII